jgi:CRISPR-associated endonuclease/helicase Cas3
VDGEPLAHSARLPGGEPQTYAEHIINVVDGTRRRAEAMTSHHRDALTREKMIAASVDGARFHDLGKLDPDIQAALRRGRDARLNWDHIDAGVAYLMAHGAETAAWIVRAHHAPGLPSRPHHFTTKNDRRLRGRRDDNDDLLRHCEQIRRTDRMLSGMLATHETALGRHEPSPVKALHGLKLRLELSCLVDADHSDTARYDIGWTEPRAPQPRWAERLASLDAYVATLGTGDGLRNELRLAFYNECRNGGPDAALVACEGPVGIGKTTAVTAYLLRRAITTGARRLIIVAPYTAILSQTARRLRCALVLPDKGDRADDVVAEHHHRADFQNISSRDLATLWTAPIVLTTAVQFFETLASNEPAVLRKLHALPGSVVFLDEAHAALPVHLWAQNWRWLRELAEDWSCSFVFASGSLARFWEIDDIVGDAKLTLPELVPAGQAERLRTAESKRIRYVAEPRFDGPGPLAEAVVTSPGPRLLIMNTVQSAAVMARHMRNDGHDTLHLSTALCPRDRKTILDTVQGRLDPAGGHHSDWTLVATSLMEAGIDLSFRTPFRERFATASLIQIGGRGNRNFEWSGGVTVHDFVVSHVDGLQQHPAATIPANVLEDLFDQGRFAGSINHADLVTLAMRLEMRQRKQDNRDRLVIAECERHYPNVAVLGRVIDASTSIVVVDPSLRERIIAREQLSAREVLIGSVQIWARKIDLLALDTLPGRQEIYWWPHAYDASFLGYMAGALNLRDVVNGKALIV